MSLTLAHLSVNTLVKDPKPCTRKWVFFGVDIFFANTITGDLCQCLLLFVRDVGKGVGRLGGFDDKVDRAGSTLR